MQPASRLRRNLRVPLLLLWLLLLTTVCVAGLTFYALRGQDAAIEQALQASRLQLSVLLATRSDHALQTALQEPLLLLRESRGSDLTQARMAALLARRPYIDAILILDREMRPVRSYPPLVGDYQQRLIGWVTERLQAETTVATESLSPMRTFVEAVEGAPAVFALVPLRAVDSGMGTATDADGGWILMQSDFDHLRSRVVMPVVRRFEREHGVSVRLLDPAAANDAGPAGVPLSPLVPGWTLALDAAAAAGGVAPAPTTWAIFVAAGGVLLAVMLISAVIAWDVRREYALVDLRNRFVANVSHELRTPLSLIRMYAETLYLKRIPDTDRQHEYLHKILLEAERLSQMIGNVLDFSRLRQGLPVYSLEATRIDATVRSVFEQYLPEWQSRGAKMRLVLAEHVQPVAHDVGGIRQILLNLVDNAIRHGAAASGIEVRLLGEDGWVHLTVADAGEGLSESAQRHLRRSMQQGRMAEDARGSGLGLALVEQISKVHRGRFRFGRPPTQFGVEAIVSFPALGAAA
ncbi:MAG: Adaptive-response sensory-kinase SasA [Gammaproteobacteria bacterium]|nr:Adaptive-response sensory-kinase SasA [Gammaproteobacteria bacterium]